MTRATAAAKGGIYLIAQTIIGKLASLAAQVALSWYLMPEDLGIASMALGFSAIFGLVQYSGVKEFLVGRGERALRRWKPVALGYSVFLAFLSIVVCLLVLAFPVFAREKEGLITLTVTGMLGAVANGLYQVLCAPLQINLRFGKIATISALSSLFTSVVAVFLAKCGAGGLSVVLAATLASATRLLWAIEQDHWRFGVSFRISRWKFLYGLSGYMIGAQVAGAAILQLAPVAIGFLSSEKEAGLYFFAFSLSMQVIQLVATNISQVIYPLLCIGGVDQGRDAEDFYKSSIEFLGAIAAPICALQLLVSPYLIHWLFPSRWTGSGEIVAILSLGLLPQVMSLSFASRLQSLGKWKLLFFVCVGNAVVSLFATGVGASVGDARGAAVGLSLYLWLAAPLNILVTLDRSAACASWLPRQMSRAFVATIVPLLAVFFYSDWSASSIGLPVCFASASMIGCAIGFWKSYVELAAFFFRRSGTLFSPKFSR